MDNPAFSQSPAFSPDAALRASRKGNEGAYVLDQTKLAEYVAPRVDDPAERMSYPDTISKAAVAFLVLLVAAGLGWYVPQLAIPGALGALILSVVNVVRLTPSPPLILAYAALEGVFVGGISSIFAALWNGIVPIALFGTIGVVGVTLALYASGRVRASRRATQVFLVALVGYAGFSLVNLLLMATGVNDSMFGIRDAPILGIPLGVPVGVIVVLLAAYSLVLDFEQIRYGVETRQRRIHGWTGAFAIVASVVWLYMEILRLLSWFMPRDD